MNSADTLLAESPMELTSSNVTSFATISQKQSLRDCVEQSMDNYFRHLDGQPVTNVYDMVLAEVEAPMLEIVMKHTRHNQTKAAQVLGLNRGTLRKKLKQYGLL